MHSKPHNYWSPHTMGLSWTGFIALKFIVVKIMGGILGALCGETMLTEQKTQRCLFLAEVVSSLPVNSQAILLMIRLSWWRGFSSPFFCDRLLCLLNHELLSQSLLLYLSLSLPMWVVLPLGLGFMNEVFKVAHLDEVLYLIF